MLLLKESLTAVATIAVLAGPCFTFAPILTKENEKNKCI
jgi:hypothetical protein